MSYGYRHGTYTLFRRINTYMAKRKSKEKKKHRVYCTYFPDGRYYIGYSCKTDKQFEKYFGSSTIVKESIDNLKKEIIAEYETRAPAKMQEFLLQWQQRHDENCINDMLHVRIRSSFLKDFEPIDWTPSVGIVHMWEEPNGT